MSTPSKPRLVVAPRRLDEALDELLDLGLGHGVAAPGVVHRRHARRRPVGLPRVVLIAVSADVVDLVDHHRAVLVAFVGDAQEVRDYAVVVVAEVGPDQHAGAVRRRRLDDDHRGAAPGALAVIGEVAVAGQPVDAHVRGMGAEDDAVLERLVTDLDGGEELGVTRHDGLPLRGAVADEISACAARGEPCSGGRLTRAGNGRISRRPTVTRLRPGPRSRAFLGRQGRVDR